MADSLNQLEPATVSESSSRSSHAKAVAWCSDKFVCALAFGETALVPLLNYSAVSSCND
jgi:hypothetical protein